MTGWTAARTDQEGAHGQIAQPPSGSGADRGCSGGRCARSALANGNPDHRASSPLATRARAAIASIPKGQWEAAYATGMTPTQAMRRTILPQAARVAVPPLANSFIALVKDTSLAAAITVPELFQAAQRIVAVTYEPLILYIEAALIYLVLSSLLSWLQTLLERRLGRYGGYLEARA